MLFNSKSKHMKKLSYLMVLTIGLLVLWGFTVHIPNKNYEEKPFTLVLDAGHGGKKNGFNIDGIKEKDLTLSIANKIKKVANSKGINVLLTRDGDKDVAIGDRLKLKGDFYLSLHVNQARDSNRNGIEIMLSNNESTTNSLKSVHMGNEIYTTLKTLDGIKIDSIPKNLNFVVLKNNVMPSMLLQLGFISNKNDKKFITNDENQTKLATAIIDAVGSYKKNIRPNYEKY